MSREDALDVYFLLEYHYAVAPDPSDYESARAKPLSVIELNTTLLPYSPTICERRVPQVSTEKYIPIATEMAGHNHGGTSIPNPRPLTNANERYHSLF